MIDRTKLETLLGSDKQMIQRFLDIFKTQTPEQLNLLKKSIGESNWEQSSITAHAIKSQCSYLGLEELSELAYKIEQLTEGEKQLGLVPGLVAQLDGQLMSIIAKELS